MTSLLDDVRAHMPGPPQPGESLEKLAWRNDEYTTAGILIGYTTNADILQDLHRAWDYATEAEPANDSEAEVRDQVRAQLGAEIRVLEALPSDAMAELDHWDRQRAAIERAYSFGASNLIAWQEAADIAQARADTLNGMVASAGDAVKTAAAGGLSLVTLVVILVAILALAGVVGKVRS